MGQLDGQIALVTGGTAGIGLATARRLAAEGATVYLTGRRQDKVDAAVAGLPGDVRGVAGDVADLGDLDQLIAGIRDEAGRLDVVVANAGGGGWANLADATEQDFDEKFDINVKGLFFTVQKALPLLTEGASVILMSSVAGINGSPRMSIYAATKAAIRNFARSWALELAPRGIRVTALCPGPVDTPSLGGFREQFEKDGASERDVAVPLGRLGDAEDVAAAALFLATAPSSFVTGSDLIVDGGMAVRA